MKNKTCKDCAHYQITAEVIDGHKKGTTEGTCRFNPPVVVTALQKTGYFGSLTTAVHSAFPGVTSEHWCAMLYEIPMEHNPRTPPHMRVSIPEETTEGMVV